MGRSGEMALYRNIRIQGMGEGCSMLHTQRRRPLSLIHGVDKLERGNCIDRFAASSLCYQQREGTFRVVYVEVPTARPMERKDADRVKVMIAVLP